MSFGGVGFATTSTSVVTFDAPAAVAGGDGTGNYIFNEIVTGSTSGTQAELRNGILPPTLLKFPLLLETSYLERESLVKTQEYFVQY